MYRRKERSRILHLMGLGVVDAKWHEIGSAIDVTYERIRQRTGALSIPVAVWLMLGLLASLIIVRTLRAALAGHNDTGDDDAATSEMLLESEPTSAAAPAPVSASY